MRNRKVPEPPQGRVTVQVLKFPIPRDGLWHEVPYHRSVDGEYGYHIGIQDGVVMLWTVPAPEQGLTDKLKVVATGESWDAKNAYVGSVQSHPFVWHVIAGGHE